MLEKPTRSLSTIGKEYNSTLREMQDMFQKYSKLRERCSELKVEYDLAQRYKIMKEKEQAVDEAIANLSTEELRELARIAKRKTLN